LVVTQVQQNTVKDKPILQILSVQVRGPCTEIPTKVIIPLELVQLNPFNLLKDATYIWLRWHT